MSLLIRRLNFVLSAHTALPRQAHTVGRGASKSHFCISRTPKGCRGMKILESGGAGMGPARYLSPVSLAVSWLLPGRCPLPGMSFPCRVPV